MAITQEEVKAIRQELNSLKPDAATTGNQELTVKQTIIALAPTLERMKKRGFELPEIVDKLHDKGIEVEAQTLAKYLAEARRQKETRKNKRQAASPHCSAPETACRNTGPVAADTPPKPPAPEVGAGISKPAERPKVRYGTFEIKPDIPLGEL